MVYIRNRLQSLLNVCSCTDLSKYLLAGTGFQLGTDPTRGCKKGGEGSCMLSFLTLGVLKRFYLSFFSGLTAKG